MTVGLDARVAALADTPAGPALAALLSDVDLAGLCGVDCVDVLAAAYRQANFERGRLLRVVAEVVVRTEALGVGRSRWPSEFAFDEVRAALVLTRRAAESLGGLAFDLVCRLPAVHAALVSGELDEPRARVFSEWTVELSEACARAVCAVLLPSAAEWTTGQLIEQVKRLAIALDPGWARRRYEQAVRGRRVVGSRNPDGSANLAGYDLPAGPVAAACARIDGLAKAAKRAGYPERLDFVRAELFLGMTDGRFAGLDDQAILAALLADLPADAADGSGEAADADLVDAADGSGEAADADAAGDADVAAEAAGDEAAGAPGAGAAAGGRAAHAAHRDSGVGADDADVEGAHPDRPDADADVVAAGAAGVGAHGAGTGAGGAGARGAAADGDLAHADDDDAGARGAAADGGSDADDGARANGADADVADGGAAADADVAAPDAAPPATAETDVAAAGIAAVDRIGDPPGGAGDAQGRAGGLGPGRRSGRGIELQVRLTTLLGLDRKPAELAGWGPIHAELAGQIAAEHGGGQWRYVITNPAGQPIAVGPLRRRPATVARTGRPGMVEIQVPEPTLRALAAAGGRPDGWHPVITEILAGLEHHPAAGDPAARLPGAALRRWIQARDRTCIFPTCRVSARNTDADHTLEHARGGPTVQTNLACPCRHDHRLRHDG